MSRKKLIRTSLYPYHVTSRSNHKTWFQLPITDVWSIASLSMVKAYTKHPVNIHAFVLMSNHYHLVLDTPDSNIDRFMYEFNKSFSTELRHQTNKINRMFGSRYKWSLIHEDLHYYHVLKYVYRNPVKANIVKRVEDYPFSTLSREIESLGMKIPIHNPYQFSQLDSLNWLNDSHSSDQNESITRGLKWGQFRFSGSAEQRKPPAFPSVNLN